MKKLLLVSALMMVSGVAAAQEVGRVISSTPVNREVGVQQRQCAPDAGPRDACRSVNNVETRTIGYKVVYEYAGKRYTTQLTEDPGATVSLQISPATAARTATRTSPSPSPVTETIYEERWDADRDRAYRVVRSTDGWDADRDRGYSNTVSVEPRYVERVYSAPSYYAPRSYYAPSYYGYYDALPLLGLSIGLSNAFRGGGYYGYGGGHYGYRGHHGHHGHRGR